MNPRFRVVLYEPYANSFYGNSRYILALARQLRSRGVDLVVVVPERHELSERILSEGGRCIILRPPTSLRRYGRQIENSSILTRARTAISLAIHNGDLLRILRRERPHLVQCHNIRALLTVCPASKALRIPILLYVKGELENPFLDGIGFRIASHILFQSALNRDQKYPSLVRRYASKISILSNAIDLREIYGAEERARVKCPEGLSLASEHGVRIVFLGSICPRKGLEFLIDALGMLHRSGLQFTAWLVGDEAVKEYREYAAEMRKKVAILGLSRRVLFTGWRSDALEILSKGDIFVLPALSEGVPKTVLEAMALGKPVVATDVGGVRAVMVSGKTGFVVAPRCSSELYAALRKLVESSELRSEFGKLARGIAKLSFSIDQHMETLVQVYDRVGTRPECRASNLRTTQSIIEAPTQ
jgi:glycosyltransferase involved in cell wall biosynthesis